MSPDLLAEVEAAAGLAVFGGSPAAERRALVAAGVPGLLAGKDPTLWGPAAEERAAGRLGWVDAYRGGRELLPRLAELCSELADLDEVVVPAPATATSAIARSLGVRLTVLPDEPPRVRDAIADPDRLARTVLVVDGPDHPLWAAFRQAHVDAGRTDAEARRHVVILGGADPDLPADPRASGPWGALTASALVPAALAGVDVAELLDQAELLAPALAADTGNPGLALGVLLGTAAGPVEVVPDGTGFEGLGEWAAELLSGVVDIEAGRAGSPAGDRGLGGLKITYGGSLPPNAVPGGGTAPDAAVNGPLGAQFLCWQYAAAVAARLRGRDPFGGV